MISDEIESPNTEELQLQQQSPFTTPSGSEESPSMWLSCIAPFQDPAPETENIVLSRMRERIEKEEFHVELKATPEEKSDILLKRFLHRHLYDLEVALVQWHGYVEWRHAQQLDQITEESIQNEREEGIFAWRGENKEGMPCCVITGRMLDPTNRKGTFVSFKKHLIKFVDEGLYHADQVSCCMVIMCFFNLISYLYNSKVKKRSVSFMIGMNPKIYGCHYMFSIMNVNL